MDFRRSSFACKVIVFVERAGFFVLLLSLASATFAFAQNASPIAPQNPTIVHVDEVSLNLVVRDHKGKIVSDLKPTDISVTDGGVPVSISSMRLVTGDGGDHLLTLVFDRFDSAGGQNAREIAAKLLKLVPQEGFSVSVLKVEGRLMLYQDFTSDRQRLSNAIASATDDENQAVAKISEVAENRLFAIAKKGTDESGAHVTPKERMTAQVTVAERQESQRVLQELHTQPALAGLLALARTQRKLPGRKTVVYFSQGLQMDTSSFERVQEIVGAADRSGVSIYTIDANALNAQGDEAMVAMMAMGNARAAKAQAPPAATHDAATMQSIPQEPPGIARMVATQLERFEFADAKGNKNPLAVLAGSTGGAYVNSGGDLKKPLRRMVEDMTTYYEASYASPVENYDGEFRPVAVKAIRQNLKINARAGYFAVPPDSVQAVRPFEAPLLKAFTEAQLPSDLAFHARVLRLGELSVTNENAVVIEVPPSALETRNDPNTNLYSLRVSIVAQIKNKAGAVIERFGEDIPRHGALSARDSMPAITMQRHFTAEPGPYVLETVVFDQISGKVGAQRTNFEIPSATDGPFLSDLALVQRIDPVQQDADPSEPMRYGNGKVVASVSDEIALGTKQFSLFFIVYPDPASKDAAKLEMEVLKSGESIAKVPLTIRQASGAVAIPYVTSIQSAKLPSGDYKIVERLSQGGKTDERTLELRIRGSNSEAKLAGSEQEPSDDDPEQMSGMQVASQANEADRLLITALPKDAVSSPTSEQLQQLIEGARKRALDYSKTLPNFLCVEMTNRSVEESGNGKWKHRDSIAELLSYHDSMESRTTLEVNGQRSSLTRADLNSEWPLSIGEFGAMLNLIFKPSSKTQFEWKETASLKDGTGIVHVLSYRVARENATIVLSQGGDQEGVGFHGLVYIEPTTSGVRRITLQADGIPKELGIRSAAMTVDYDFVAISGRDYLMPVRSSVMLQRAHKKPERNEITFRNYRRFASRTKIKMIH